MQRTTRQYKFGGGQLSGDVSQLSASPGVEESYEYMAKSFRVPPNEGMIMKQFKIILIASVCLPLLAATALAQETNAPRTRLETFEAQTGVVIIKDINATQWFGQAGRERTECGRGVHRIGLRRRQALSCC
jgi:hypothetical protein